MKKKNLLKLIALMLLCCQQSLFSQSQNQKTSKDLSSKEMKSAEKLQNEITFQEVEIVQNLESIKSEYDTLPSTYLSSKTSEIKNKMYRLTAEEAEKIDPNLVQIDFDGSKNIDYTSLVTLLLAVVHEQELRIENLEKEITNLKK